MTLITDLKTLNYSFDDLDNCDQNGTKTDTSKMELEKMWKWLFNWFVELCLVSCEVPPDNGSSNDEILTSDDELSDKCERYQVADVSRNT